MNVISDILVTAGLRLPPKPSLARLLRNNDPPDSAERGLCMARISSLESQIAQLTTRIEVLQALTGTFSIASRLRKLKEKKRLRNLLDTRRKHCAIVSTMRTIPIDVWQRIFFFVAFPDEIAYQEEGSNFQHDYWDLRTACAVSSRWREAAIGFALLWTCLPKYTQFKGMYETPRIPTVMKMRVAERYLTRSKGAPICFSFLMWDFIDPQPPEQEQFRLPGPLIDDSKAALKLLSKLLKHVKRWRYASLDLDAEAIREASQQISGQIPLLATLHLQFRFWKLPEVSIPVRCFAIAPALREARIQQKQCYRFGEGSSLRPSSWVEVDLPWSQLACYESDTQTGLLCKQMLQGTSLLHLGTLKWTPAHYSICSEMFEDLRNINLPALHTFEFRPLGPDHWPYIYRLLLPALAHLTVKASREDDCLDAVAHMIRQSGCSLLSLVLILHPDDEIDHFRRICSLSPRLHTLTIDVTNIELLSLLFTSNPTSSFNSALPHLQTLTVTRKRYESTPISCRDQADILSKVLAARKALSCPFALHFKKFIYDWHFKRCHRLILELFYLTGQTQVQEVSPESGIITSWGETYDEAIDAVNDLKSLISSLCWIDDSIATKPYAREFNLEMMQETYDQVKRRLEHGNIESRASCPTEAGHIFLAVGVLALLDVLCTYEAPKAFRQTSKNGSFFSSIQPWARETRANWKERLLNDDSWYSRGYQWKFPVGGRLTSVTLTNYDHPKEAALEQRMHQIDRDYLTQLPDIPRVWRAA